MILAIDVGNTNIVLGAISDGEVLREVRIHTDRHVTDAEIAISIRQVLEYCGLSVDSIDGSIVASVVPSVTDALRVALANLTGKKPLVVGPGMKTGMNVRIDDPSTLAADLAVGSIAAMQYYGTPSIIIDMGTATTVVVVDKTGSYIGGAIYPGLHLSMEALSSGTSLLPSVSIAPPKKVIGTNTVDCMQSGAVFGTASMLDGMIDRMEEEMGCKCTVVATGGLAGGIVPCCRHEIIYDSDLLMKGLWYLYQKNT